VRPALAAVVLALAGCAPHFDLGGGDWAKPGAQVQQTTLDETECARLASRAYGTPDLILGGLLDVGRIAVQESRQQAAFDGCMTSAGYQRAS